MKCSTYCQLFQPASSVLNYLCSALAEHIYASDLDLLDFIRYNPLKKSLQVLYFLNYHMLEKYYLAGYKIKSQRKAMPNMFKLLHNCTHLTHQQSNAQSSPSQENTVLQQYMNCELPNVQMDLEKAEEPEIKLPTSTGKSKKQESSRKTSISALLTMPKPLTVWITINCGKF